MLVLLTTGILSLVGGANADYRLQWRHALAGDSPKFVSGCSPEGSSAAGAPYVLKRDLDSCDDRYRGGEVVTDKLGPIFWGGFYHYKAMCMDAGEDVRSGARPTVQDCVDKKHSQQWVIHSSNGQVELGCTGYCLDVMDGVDQIQIWDCSTGNKNQEFDVVQVAGSG